MHHDMERMSTDMRSSAAAAAAVSSRIGHVDPYSVDPLAGVGGGVGGMGRSRMGGMDDGRGRMGVDDGRGRMMGDHVDVDRSRSADHRTRMDRSKSPVPEFNVRQGVEIVELQDKLEKTNNELRRAQAELRLNQSDYDRSHVELEQLHEKVRGSLNELENSSSMGKTYLFSILDVGWRMVVVFQRGNLQHILDLVLMHFTLFQIEKSQAEIYRLRAKLESTQTENENYHDELEKLQSVVNKSYSDKDRFVSDLDKLREELERSQVGHSTWPADLCIPCNQWKLSWRFIPPSFPNLFPLDGYVILDGIREMHLEYRMPP